MDVLRFLTRKEPMAVKCYKRAGFDIIGDDGDKYNMAIRCAS